MLKYFIETTENLIPLVIVLGLLFACMYAAYSRLFKWIWLTGIFAGLGGAVVMAVFKNTTSLVHTGNWNIRLFTASLIALGVLGVCMIPPLRKRGGKVITVISSAAAAVIAAAFEVYSLPDIMSAPFTFSLNGASVLSTDYLFRFLGWAAGIVLAWVAFYAVKAVASKMYKNPAVGVLIAVLCINAASQAAKLIQILVSRRVIKGDIFFNIAIYTSNYSDTFTYLMIAVTLILPVVLIVKSFHIREPFENAAQKRKLVSGWKKARRWAVTLMICFGLTILCMTWLSEISSREAELSPVEESRSDGENVYVSFEQVEDGHLHRFGYTTPSGKNVRFIVIKKPNSNAYGIGLDACEICGETGYFERNDQIVCKLCDVVMNVNTIGFKGGCNPIPIEYSIKDGSIIVPVSTLTEHEDIFK